MTARFGMRRLRTSEMLTPTRIAVKQEPPKSAIGEVRNSLMRRLIGDTVAEGLAIGHSRMRNSPYDNRTSSPRGLHGMTTDLECRARRHPITRRRLNLSSPS